LFFGLKIFGSNFARFVEINSPPRPGDPAQGTQVILLVEIGLKLPCGLVLLLDAGDDLLSPGGSDHSPGGAHFSGVPGWLAFGWPGGETKNNPEQSYEPKAKRLNPSKFLKGENPGNTHWAHRFSCLEKPHNSIKDNN
jgi:hypothetical protein